MANRSACGCRSGILIPSFDFRVQGEPGDTPHVGHATLSAGHIFRSYFANSWALIDIEENPAGLYRANPEVHTLADTYAKKEPPLQRSTTPMMLRR